MAITLREKQLLDHQGIVEALKEEIASGTLAPGQRITEIQLIQRFGLSRNKVREALKQLDADAFVKVTPHVGAVVAELSQKDVAHSYDVMGVLEGLAARVATPYITGQHLAELQSLLDEMDAAQDPSTFIIPNDQFHTFISSLSENEQLIRITSNLRCKLMRFGLQALHNPLQLAASRRDHKRIFEAIRQIRPTKAEQYVRDHYLNAKNRLIKGMNKSL